MKIVPELRIRTSVIFLLLATTLFTFAIVGSGMLAVMVPRIAEENAGLVEKAAEEAAARVAIFLLDLEARVARAGDFYRTVPADRLSEILGIAQGSTIEAIYMVGADGNLEGKLINSSIPDASPQRVAELEGIDLSTYPLYLAALQQGRPVWSDKHISAVTGGVTVGLAVPVRGREAVVVAELALDTLIQISRISQGAGGLDLWIIDRKGEIVADSNEGELERLNLFNVPIVRAGLEGAPLPKTMELGGRSYQVSAARSETLGWLIVSRIPAGLANEHLREVVVLILVAFGGSALVGLLLAPLWAQNIARPLRAVAWQARQIASGGHPEAWPAGGIRELNQLSRDLELMGESIRRREEDLRKLNEELESRVAQRTEALSRSNRDLSEALHHLEQAKDELIQSEKLAALGRLVAGVSHELNTPLGNGRLAVTTLGEKLVRFQKATQEGLRRSDLEAFIEGVRVSIDIAERNLMRASELIGSFKRVAADRTSSRRRKFRLREVVDEVVLTISPSMKRRPIELRVDLPKDLWLDSYPGELGQVLTNLIDNCVRYAFKDRERGSIAISAKRLGDDKVSILLRDDGIGMTPEVARRAFDPFFTTSMGQGGTGLGLFIAHSSMTNVLGGSIALETSPGRGASFELRMPLIAPHSEPQAISAAPPHQAD